MNEPKAGSRKAKVKVALKESGADAAVELGTSLGLKLGTIKSWLNAWAKESGEAPAKIKTKHTASGYVSPKKNRVRELGFPRTRHGTVVAAGPEASMVQWDEREHRNDERAVSNEHLIKLNADGSDDEDAMTEFQRKESARLELVFAARAVAKAKEDKKAARAKEINMNSNKQRVYDTRLEEYGVMIAEGPEQSEVRYDDGVTRYQSTKALKKV